MANTLAGLLGRGLNNLYEGIGSPSWNKGEPYRVALGGLLSGDTRPLMGLLNAKSQVDPNEALNVALNFNSPMTLGGLLGHTVWHGSPHKFDKFDMSKIGTGEGAQAYGHGLYFAESPEVARSYLKAGGDGGWLTVTLPNGKQVIGDQINDKGLEAIKWLEQGQEVGRGGSYAAWYAKQKTNDADVHKLIDEWKDAKIGYQRHDSMYKVDIPDEILPRMLDWDKPLSQQPNVKSVFDSLGLSDKAYGGTGGDGQNLFKAATQKYGSQKEAAEYLKSQGIPGIRYLDGNSRIVPTDWTVTHPKGGQQTFPNEQQAKAFIARYPNDGYTLAPPKSPTYNYVLFDDTMPKILERNGQPLTGLLSQ